MWTKKKGNIVSPHLHLLNSIESRVVQWFTVSRWEATQPKLSPCTTSINNEQWLNATEKMQTQFIFQVNSISRGAILLHATYMQTNYQNLHFNALPRLVMNNKHALNVAKTMEPLSVLQVNDILGDAMLFPTTFQQQQRWRYGRVACYRSKKHWNYLGTLQWKIHEDAWCGDCGYWQSLLAGL